MQVVIKATLIEAAGRSLHRPHLLLGNKWELQLACGHTVYRRVRYVGRAGERRGWLVRRSSEDALPAPRRVVCEWC